MNLETLSDTELTSALDNLTGAERETTVAILFHLIEMERRKLFRELGYGNLFDYCTRRLFYSPASAYRRIAAARCLRENPEVAQLLRDGKVTLCTVSTAAKSIEKEITKIEDIVGRSKREVEAIVAKAEPVANKPKEMVKQIVVSKAATLFEEAPEERFTIRFSLGKEDYDRFEEAKAKLSHTLGRELTSEAVVSKLLVNFLKPAKIRQGSSEGRYVSKSIKQEVYRRDRGQCSFISDDGVRCTERRYLHIDHIMPFAAGGKTELNNLRLLCPCHSAPGKAWCFQRVKFPSCKEIKPSHHESSVELMEVTT